MIEIKLDSTELKIIHLALEIQLKDTEAKKYKLEMEIEKTQSQEKIEELEKCEDLFRLLLATAKKFRTFDQG